MQSWRLPRSNTSRASCLVAMFHRRSSSMDLLGDMAEKIHRRIVVFNAHSQQRSPGANGVEKQEKTSIRLFIIVSFSRRLAVPYIRSDQRKSCVTLSTSPLYVCIVFFIQSSWLIYGPGHTDAYTKAGIMHRDISAGNILIDECGAGMLIDWDLCMDINCSSVRRREWRIVCFILSP